MPLLYLQGYIHTPDCRSGYLLSRLGYCCWLAAAHLSGLYLPLVLHTAASSVWLGSECSPGLVLCRQLPHSARRSPSPFPSRLRWSQRAKLRSARRRTPVGRKKVSNIGLKVRPTQLRRWQVWPAVSLCTLVVTVWLVSMAGRRHCLHGQYQHRGQPRHVSRGELLEKARL
jgi:hypothetical protein